MTRWRPQVRPLHRPLETDDTEGPPDRGRDPPGERASDEPCGFDSRPFRSGASRWIRRPFDGVRGVTAAREPVELEATGSTPAGYPDRNPGGRDEDAADVPGSFTGACSWESSEPPKLADRVQILAPLLAADVAERRGPCLVSRFMPVRVRPSASLMPSACDGRHATPRRSKTRFDSWRGHSLAFPAGVADARRSSKPQGRVRFPGGGLGIGLFRWMSSGCDGRAHDPAKVEAQVRFLARTWPSVERAGAFMAPEPDGRAAVCKTAEAGSTPAGASRSPAPVPSRPEAKEISRIRRSVRGSRHGRLRLLPEE